MLCVLFDVYRSTWLWYKDNYSMLCVCIYNVYRRPYTWIHSASETLSCGRKVATGTQHQLSGACGALIKNWNLTVKTNVILTPNMDDLSEHYMSLTCEVKCACGGYLQPPIRLCVNGHGVCKQCRRSAKRCPTCKEVFTETRSMALEALVEKMQFPCPHQGCDANCLLSELEAHAEDCKMRATTCFMAKFSANGCDWMGQAADWLEHCIAEHKDHVTDLPFVTFSGPWTPRSRNPVMRYHLLRCFDRVFNVYQIYDAKSGKMMWSIVTTGNLPAETKSFYFDLEIYNPHDLSRKISFRQSCKNGDDLDILDSNQNVLLPLEQIIYMLDADKNLHFQLRVSESTEQSKIPIVKPIEH